MRRQMYGVITLTGFLCLLFLSGCSLWKLQPPSVTLVGIQVLEASVFEQRFAFKLRLQNHNDWDIPIRGVSFEVQLNDQSFARGVSAQPVTLPRLGEAVLEVTAVSDLAGILRQIHALRQGQQTSLSYRLRGRLVTDAIRDLHFENQGTIALPIPPGEQP